MGNRSFLDSSFMKLLMSERICNLSDALSCHLSEDELDKPRHSGTTRYKRSDSMSASIEEYLGGETNPDSIRAILQGYINAVLDLSIHEISVCNLKHSSCVVDGFYSRLETKFLRETLDFFTDVDPRRLGKDILEIWFSMDMQLVTTLFLNRTLDQYIQQITEQWINMLDRSLSHHITGGPVDSNIEQKSRTTSLYFDPAPQNADINLLMQHSVEPQPQLDTRKTSNQSSDMIKQLQSQLMKNMKIIISKHVDSDIELEEGDESMTSKPKTNSLMKFNSTQDVKDSQGVFLSTIIHRSHSCRTENKSDSPLPMQKQILNLLVVLL